MPATTPDAIWYPNDTSPVAPLENLFSTLATSVQVALTAFRTSLSGLDQPWTTLTPASGWTAGTGSSSPQVMRRGTMIFFKGSLFGGTGTATTMPSWAQPARATTIPIATNSGAAATATISSAGLVTFPGAVAGLGTQQASYSIE